MKCPGRERIMTDLQQSLAVLSAHSTRWSLQHKLDSRTYRGSSSFTVSTFKGVWPWTYTAGWSVLTVIFMTVLKGSAVLDGLCQAILWMCLTTQAEIQQINATHRLLCREERWKGASSLFSLVHFWVLICFSESWSHSSALWALGLEYTRDLCTGCTVVQRRKREKIECGFEVRICRAAVRACIGCSNRSRAISPPFSSVFLLCAPCIYIYIYIWYKIAYTENLINYIFTVIDLKLWHTLHHKC